MICNFHLPVSFDTRISERYQKTLLYWLKSAFSAHDLWCQDRLFIQLFHVLRYGFRGVVVKCVGWVSR